MVVKKRSPDLMQRCVEVPLLGSVEVHVEEVLLSLGPESIIETF